MIWSVSSYNQFQRCQRQWYYRYVVADAKVKRDAYRREVTILSKMSTLDSWRGSVVDAIISFKIVPALNRRTYIHKERHLTEADILFNRQLAFAKSKGYRAEGFRFSQEEDFAAFYAYDNEQEIGKDEIERARADVRLALTNFLENEQLLDYLKSARKLIPQRGINYKFNRFTIRGYPDLIVFFDNQPPHIFDWKVHTFGTKAYDDQLFCYAVALTKVAPHIDFPSNLSDYTLLDYRLSEYQLLLNEQRDYRITEDQVEEIDDYISRGILKMYLAGAHKKYNELTPQQFSTTNFLENCPACPFKKLCKQHDNELRN